jgi:nicotinamide mononucleotide (NMN) deamidase PncC
MTDFLERLKGAKKSVHVIATGAGAGIADRLWSMPGASAYLSGVSFPYAAAETRELLGFSPEGACSEDTAIDLACAAFMKAYRFGGNAPVGVGVTAAVPTDRARRGKDRAHFCVVTDDQVLAASVEFPKHTRATAGTHCDSFALDLLADAMGMGGGPIARDVTAKARERFFLHPYFDPTGRRFAAPPAAIALMPGAFDPPHAGHFGIADEVERRHHVPVVFHVTADTPHKGELSVQELLRRGALLRGHRALFTRGDPLYIDKARRFPGVPLVLGSDALARMLDPKWGPAVKPMLYEFARLGTRFFVSPRTIGGKRLTVDEAFYTIDVDCELRELFIELDGSFSESSRELRAAS